MVSIKVRRNIKCPIPLGDLTKYKILVHKVITENGSGTLEYMGYGSATNGEVEDGGNVCSSYQLRKDLEKVSNLHCKFNVFKHWLFLITVLSMIKSAPSLRYHCSYKKSCSPSGNPENREKLIQFTCVFCRKR